MSFRIMFQITIITIADLTHMYQKLRKTQHRATLIINVHNINNCHHYDI